MKGLCALQSFLPALAHDRERTATGSPRLKTANRAVLNTNTNFYSSSSGLFDYVLGNITLWYKKEWPGVFLVGHCKLPSRATRWRNYESTAPASFSLFLPPCFKDRVSAFGFWGSINLGWRSLVLPHQV